MRVNGVVWTWLSKTQDVIKNPKPYHLEGREALKLFNELNKQGSIPRFEPHDPKSMRVVRPNKTIYIKIFYKNDK